MSRRRVTLACGLMAAFVAAPAHGAVRKTTRRAKTRSATTVVRPGGAPSTAAPVPATSIAVDLAAPPAAAITGVTVAEKSVTIAVTPTGDPSLTGTLVVTAEGMSRGGVTLPVDPLATSVVVPFGIDPETLYRARLVWARNGVEGTPAERTLGPRYPIPIRRDPPPIAGPGWLVLRDSKDRATRRNPCIPLRVVYDDRNQRVALDPLLARAVARAAEVSGVPLQYGGITHDPVADPRTTLLVSWRKDMPSSFVAATYQTFAADPAGVVWRINPSIRANANRNLPSEEYWYSVLLHELGHLLGLDHSNDPTSMMFSPVESGVPRPQIFTDYNNGDRIGLFEMNGRLAADGCIPADPSLQSAPAG